MSAWTVVVALLVSTQSGVTPNTIRHLKDQVAATFLKANVQIRWVEQTEPGALVVTLLRAIPLLTGCESAFGCSIPETGGRSHTTFIASEAVWQYERPRPAIRGRLLSFVVAHELGHLIGLFHTRERSMMHRDTEWMLTAQWSAAERSALAAILASAAGPARPGDAPDAMHEAVLRPLPMQTLLAQRSIVEPVGP